MMNKQMRDILIEAYLDYLNNYVSYKTYAEHNGFTEQQSLLFIELANSVFTMPHPEA